jgi:glycosyltransferase involved in cell wall biosynthesis
VILAVGRQEYQKAHVDLVAAAAQVAAGRERIVVLIAGRSGNASGDLEAALADAGLGDRVRLLGHRDDVADLLCAADVFAMPSRYEGTAGAALEAMALEAPIVSTDLQGTRGVLVDGRNALLVPVGDADRLAAALERMLEDRAFAARCAAVARADFEERFTLERAADGMVSLYEDVVSRTGRRVARRRRAAGAAPSVQR